MQTRVTTESGAIYLIDLISKHVTGGSKELKNGQIVNLYLEVGSRLLINTPERAKQNPTAVQPGVISSPIVKIEQIDEDGEVVQVYE